MFHCIYLTTARKPMYSIFVVLSRQAEIYLSKYLRFDNKCRENSGFECIQLERFLLKFKCFCRSWIFRMMHFKISTKFPTHVLHNFKLKNWAEPFNCQLRCCSIVNYREEKVIAINARQYNNRNCNR